VAFARMLLALLLGYLLGVGSALYGLHAGAGDFVIKRTEIVQDIERRLRDSESQRDQLGRQLNDMVARSEKMERSFDELERKFRDIDRSRPVEAPRPVEPARPVEPPPGSAGTGDAQRQ
jgi:hypothetical protein